VAGVAAADGTPGVCEDVRKADGEFGKHSGPPSFFLLLAIERLSVTPNKSSSLVFQVFK